MNIKLLEQTETDLKENSVWQHYEFDNKESYILIKDDLQKVKIINLKKTVRNPIKL